MAAGDRSPDLIEAKRALRAAMTARREALDGRARAEAAARLAAAIGTMPEVASARIVAAYAPIRGEIDPGPAVAAAVARGAAVVYPRIGGAAGAVGSAAGPRLSFHRIPGVAALVPGALGVPEPPPGAPAVPLEAVDVFLVPGLAFDARGFRLGYGRGYYDEVVAHLRAAGRGFFLGVGHDFQVVEDCPAGAGDQPLDAVATEARVLRAARGPAAGSARDPGEP
jgi:5-formyltetrahydrofolate cyclo-ligase